MNQKPQDKSKPAAEKPTHFFGATAFNWATADTRQGVIDKLAKHAGADAIRRALSRKGDGLYVWTCIVNAPESTNYQINNFSPVGVEYDFAQHHHIVSVKGYVRLIEKTGVKA